MSLDNEMSTAKICAFARAYHANSNKEKIFDDYLAPDFMGEEGYNQFDSLVATTELFDVVSSEISGIETFADKFLIPITLPRASFAETKLEAFAQKYQPCQYVICGAGYDTFSFRNKNPNIEIFEVDHPNMQRFKRGRIEKLKWDIPENIHFVEVDFEKDNFISQLLDAGFDPTKKTFFSILGVAYYLALPVFAKTVSFISHIALPGSMLVFDYPDETINHKMGEGHLNKLAQMTKQLGETMNGGYYFDDLCEALRSEDFKMESHLAASDIQERFFAGRSDDLKAIDNIYLVTAIKKEDTNYTI